MPKLRPNAPSPANPPRVRGRSRVRLPALFAIAAALSGCGYRFTPDGGALPGDVRSVYVPMFVNRTSEPAVEAIFTDALRSELARRGREGGELSDARIEGELTQIVGTSGIVTVKPAANTNVLESTVTTFRVTASARVRLKRGGETLADISVSGTEDYLNVGGSILETEANRRNALRRLAVTLMERAYTRLASGF